MERDIIEVKINESPKDWTASAKGVADIAGPVLTAIVAVAIVWMTKRLERSQWRNQKLIEKRISIWDEVGPDINDIYCYCMRVGSWKDFRTPDVIAKKRKADKCVHHNRPFFGATFFTQYRAFIDICFDTYQGHGMDAKLKTCLAEHRGVNIEWKPDWEILFSPNPIDEKALKASYESLLAIVRLELSPGRDPA